MILAQEARIQLSLQGQNFRKNMVARDAQLERNLTWHKGNLVTKDARLGMKEVATEM